MTRPDEALAIHNDRAGHSVSWVKLDDGCLLQSAGASFRTSDDGGLSWSEPYDCIDTAGNRVGGSGASLVRLDGAGVGLAANLPVETRGHRRAGEIIFWRSTDAGVTWEPPVTITPPGRPCHALQDVLVRTGSGRIVMPTYLTIGQGWYWGEGAAVPGALVDGQFVSTDAHFVDPHFGASEVYYSDDDGLTWQPNSDGEIFIQTEWAGPFHATFEPTVAEVTPGRLVMLLRTNVGRLYQAWSDDDGDTWTRPQATVLAASPAPAQVRALPMDGHLLVVWTQQSAEEIMQGYVRTRLSAAVSRNGGGVWEFYQNVESLHEQTRVEPGAIRVYRPESAFTDPGTAAHERPGEHVVDLPLGWGRWSYPSVLVDDDRVLVSHSFTETVPDPERAEMLRTGPDGTNSKLKVLPISWFYGGREPADNPSLVNYASAASP